MIAKRWKGAQQYFPTKIAVGESPSGAPASNFKKQDVTRLLADELLLSILTQVSDAPSLAVAAQVCRRWNRVLDDEQVWRELCTYRSFAPLIRREATQNSFFLVSFEDLLVPRVPRLTVVCRHWKRVYRDNHITNVNWKKGLCRVRTVRDVDGGEGDLPMQFDDSWVVSVAMGEAGKVWDMETGKCRLRLSGHDGTISAVKFDRKWVVTGGIDATLKIWDAATGTCVRTLVGHLGEIVAVQHSNETIVSGSEDTSIRIWEMETGECQQILEGHSGAVCSLHFDDEVVISGSADSYIKIWTRTRGHPTSTQPQVPQEHLPPPRTLAGHTGPVFCLQVSSEYICSGSEDAKIKLWSRGTGDCVRTLEGHTAAVICLQFDDVKVVSGGSDRFIKVWDLSTGHCLYSLMQHTATVWNLKFSTTRLTTSSFDRSLLVWDFAARDEETVPGNGNGDSDVELED
ncbi:hypothetical protein PhCBS80983_g03772 [Powellomyces hirtus]|uniref:F-box domain-containing protein n=1 Tax=Powellomyces hirtus TaxID=109895 RepID=A0A507E0G2_9FUNG|nr:hypothetical protein PhCBS80983_g03772 [Powellomyces hirtus]